MTGKEESRQLRSTGEMGQKRNGSDPFNDGGNEWLRSGDKNIKEQSAPGQFCWGLVSGVLMAVGGFSALGVWGGAGESNALFNNRFLALSVLFSIGSVIILATAVLLVRVLHFFLSKGEWLGGVSELQNTNCYKYSPVTVFAYGLLISLCSLCAGYFVTANFLLLVSGKVFYIFKDL